MKLTYLLWIVQVLLAGLFLYAGGVKFTLPPEVLAGPLGFPVPFILFIGVCEVLGGLGLILPGLLRIRPGLTPLAAGGLTIIMVGAVVVTVMVGMASAAWLPLLAGLAAAFVAYGRWRLAPIQGR